MKQYLKPTLIIVGIILLASAISRVLTSSETLAEYAEHNKASNGTEIAYSTESETDSAKESVPATETIPASTEAESTADKESAASQTEKETEALLPETEQTDEKLGENDITLSFYYEPLSEEIINKITGISYVENENVSLEDLRYLHLLHYNFDGETVEGELICNKAIAQDLLEIFYELYLSEYRIEKVRLIDE